MTKPDDPTDLPARGWRATAKRAFAEFRADDMMTWAAALTYYAVLSVFPAMIALIALIGVVGQHPATTNALLDIIGSIAPKDLVNVLRGTIEGLVTNKSGAGALLSFGLITAIWSASGYIGAFFKASNAIYEVEEGRKAIRLRAVQLGLTLLFLVVVAFGAVVFVASGEIARAIGDTIGLGDTAVTVWTYAKWPVLGLVVAVMLALLYWAAPNVKQPKLRWLTPGGLIGLVLLVAASALFAFYVTNFASYGKTYGALAALPIGLTWLWICNLAILFGAEFDAELARQREIEAGMRPPDKEPFLPPRETPKDKKDGGDLAREEVEGEGAAAPAAERTPSPPAERTPPPPAERTAPPPAERPAGAEASNGAHTGTGRFKRRSGGLVGKLIGR
jgi:membrane protein